MEALDFLKEYNRMCMTYKSCSGCPLEMDRCAGCGDELLFEKQIINVIDKTKQWSKEHPIITNAQKLKEVFGDKAVYAISSPNVQALKDWLDEQYKEPKDETM